MSWLIRILGMIPFSLIEKVSGDIKDARLAQLKAETDEEKIAAEERMETAKLKFAYLTKAREYQSVRIIQFMFGLLVFILLGKLWIWDRVLGWGTTDNLPPEQWGLVATILAGFFYLESKVRR